MFLLRLATVERRLFNSIDDAKRIFLIEEGRAALMGTGIDISHPNGNIVIDIGGVGLLILLYYLLMK